jgi:serine/threonine protein kinase
VGRYQIEEPIGAGGMGEVYRARDPLIGRLVAIKVMPEPLSQVSARLLSFEREVHAAGALNHPNILSIFDTGTHDGLPYVVYEFLEGETLRGHLQRGKLPDRKAADFAVQIATGLKAAHEKHIVHRDLKPDNLLVTVEGRLKILDFGLAKLTQPEAENWPVGTLPTESMPSLGGGTYGYMSPEQVRGSPTDFRSDIFSFGVILYEMLAGLRAFGGKSPADVIANTLNQELPELRNVPAALNLIARRCLDRVPGNRFQSTADLLFALQVSSLVPTGELSAPATLKTILSREFLSLGSTSDFPCQRNTTWEKAVDDRRPSRPLGCSTTFSAISSGRL